VSTQFQLTNISYNIVTSCALGCPGFEFRERLVTVLSPKHSTSALRPSQYLKRHRSSFLMVKQSRCEFDHYSTSRAEVKHEWSYTSAPPVSLSGMERGNVTLAFINM